MEKSGWQLGNRVDRESINCVYHNCPVLTVITLCPVPCVEPESKQTPFMSTRYLCDSLLLLTAKLVSSCSRNCSMDTEEIWSLVQDPTHYCWTIKYKISFKHVPIWTSFILNSAFVLPKNNSVSWGSRKGNWGRRNCSIGTLTMSWGSPFCQDSRSKEGPKSTEAVAPVPRKLPSSLCPDGQSSVQQPLSVIAQLFEDLSTVTC